MGKRETATFLCRLRAISTIAVQRKAAGEGFPLCTAIDEIARSLRRNFASFRFPIGPFPSIRICFEFRASNFGFTAPPGCALRVSAVKWAARKESPPAKKLRAFPCGLRIVIFQLRRASLFASLRFNGARFNCMVTALMDLALFGHGSTVERLVQRDASS